LFCQGGGHWNYLGAYYTVRALVEELNGLMNKKAGRLDLEAVNIDRTPVGTDRDLAELLNLFFPPLDYVVPHPVISLKGGTEDLGNAVIVGDSFSEIPINLLNEHKIFKRIDFFYYYKLTLRSFPDQQSFPVDVAKIDWENMMFKSDVIILEANESFITASYTSSFVTDALEQLRNFPSKS
jgi:alginate O-acetyltransferase complex protein AlgJ